MADDLSGALLGLRAWRASRRGLLAGLGAGLAGAPLLGGGASAAACTAQVSPRPLSVRQDAGAVGDGRTDVTSAVSKLYQRAALTGAAVEWDAGLRICQPGCLVSSTPDDASC